MCKVITKLYIEDTRHVLFLLSYYYSYNYQNIYLLLEKTVQDRERAVHILSGPGSKSLLNHLIITQICLY